VGYCFCLVLQAAMSCAQERPKEQDYKLALREYAGNYQVDSRRAFVVSLAFRGELGYIDVSSDLSDDLKQIKADEFQGEDKTLIRFVRDQQGIVRSLRFIQPNVPEVSAQRVSTIENEVAVTSRNAEIRGTLIVPPSGNRLVALIIEGGSGWRFQEDMLDYARLAAAHGYASFVWDRRGWGTSNGERAASFADLAEDVAAIAAELRRNPKIDPSKIGVWGFSQAGWIGTLAASRSRNIGFIALFSPALSLPFRQEEQSVGHTLRADGESAAEIQQARDLFHAKLEFAMFRSDWSRYYSLRQAIVQKSWFRFLDAPQDPSDPEFQFLRLNSHYNSLNALAAIHVPLLALFGEFDTNVTPDTGMSLLEQGLDLAGNKSLTMRMIPNANHSLIGVQSSKPNDFIRPVKHAPGVWSYLWDWLAEVTGNGH
jgi:pimeloyl-ACP methyl ester carboxylesterase